MSSDPVLPPAAAATALAVAGPATEPPPATTEPDVPPVLGRTERRVRGVLRFVVAAVAIWLFLAAITVMKDGAQPLRPLLLDSPFTDSMGSTLGFGWVGAMVVMSGSPVAVAGLTFLSEGVIDAAE